jgi:hypothetical protein
VHEWLLEKNLDEMAIIEDSKHKGHAYVFSDAGVKVHVVSTKNLGEAVAYITTQNHSVPTSQSPT